MYFRSEIEIKLHDGVEYSLFIRRAVAEVVMSRTSNECDIVTGASATHKYRLRIRICIRPSHIQVINRIYLTMVTIVNHFRTISVAHGHDLLVRSL